MRSRPGSRPSGPPIDGPGEIGVLAQRSTRWPSAIAERAELSAALARGDRLASVGVMSAQVAHEINNPLTTVLGYAKLLLEDKPEGHPDRAALELIADEAERMKKIIGSAARVRARAAPESEPAIAGSAAGTLEPATVRPPRRRAASAPQLKKARATLATDVAATTRADRDRGARAPAGARQPGAERRAGDDRRRRRSRSPRSPRPAASRR